MKQLLVKSAVIVAVIALLVPVASATVSIIYDAGPAGGGPANIDPVLQSNWVETEVDRSGGPLTNVFDLQPDGLTGFNATQLNDQQGTGNPSPNDNPGYNSFMTSGQYQQMFDNGWEFNARFRPEQGGGFAAWGINPSSVTDPGWALPGRRRVGFSVSVDAADNSAVVAPVGGTTINLGADSAEDYHLITAVGEVGSSAFDIFIDGVFNQTSAIENGGSNSSSDNRTLWQSGSSGGTGRVVNWNLVSLTAVPEPSTFVLCGLGLIGVAGLRRRS